MNHIDRGLGPRDWPTQIKGAMYFYNEEEGEEYEEVLRLKLSDGRKVVTLWLDGDTVADFLMPAIGEFKEAPDIIGRRVTTVLDAAGNVVQLRQNQLLQQVSG